MNNAALKLIDLLDIEHLEVDLFRGSGAGGETPQRIYGGQVIAQALMAAYRTVDDRMCHSLHAYFIRAGDQSIPVIYEVDRARDGGSFTTRRVVAIQHGRQIFNLSASFHVAEEGWAHQHPMPVVPGPEGLMSRDEQRARDAHLLPEKHRAEFTRARPIDVSDVDPQDMFKPGVQDDRNHSWIRMKEAAGHGYQMQHCLLAYASDMNLLGSSLRPHGLTWFQGKVMSASLDHAMWFHAPLAFENWHLYSMDAPFTGGGRGLNRGAIYNQDGVLVATTMQEGLIRPRKPK